MDGKKITFLEKHWGWMLQLVLFIFFVGVTYATINEAIKNRPDRTEINDIIDMKLNKQYIRSDQVPGLNENLQGIKSQIEDIKKSNDLILQKIMKGN